MNEPLLTPQVVAREYLLETTAPMLRQANGEFRLPSSAKVRARERLLRDAEIVRSAGKAWIADAMVVGATDALPEDVAADIVAATALAVSEIEQPPGWVVTLIDETARPFGYWSHVPSRSEASR